MVSVGLTAALYSTGSVDQFWLQLQTNLPVPRGTYPAVGFDSCLEVQREAIFTRTDPQGRSEDSTMIVSDDAAFAMVLAKALAIIVAAIILLGHLTWYGARRTFKDRKDARAQRSAWH